MPSNGAVVRFMYCCFNSLNRFDFLYLYHCVLLGRDWLQIISVRMIIYEAVGSKKVSLTINAFTCNLFTGIPVIDTEGLESLLDERRGDSRSGLSGMTGVDGIWEGEVRIWGGGGLASSWGNAPFFCVTIVTWSSSLSVLAKNLYL